MANVALWNGALTYSAAFGAEINSLAADSSVTSSIVITNGSTLNTDGWVSFSLSGTPSAPIASIGFYLLPLNQDGTTYGDGFTSGGGTPSNEYLRGNATVQTSASASTMTGTLFLGVIPPGSFKLAIYNGTGNALAASAGTISFASNAINLAG